MITFPCPSCNRPLMLGSRVCVGCWWDADEPTKSRDHVCFLMNDEHRITHEVFAYGDGQLARASIYDCIAIDTGKRHAQHLCSRAHWDRYGAETVTGLRSC